MILCIISSKHCVGLMPQMESSDINRGGNCCFVVMTGCTATNKRGNRNFVELEVGSGRRRRRGVVVVQAVVR